MDNAMSSPGSQGSQGRFRRRRRKNENQYQQSSPKPQPRNSPRISRQQAAASPRPADLTVIVDRVDLCDNNNNSKLQAEERSIPREDIAVAPYHFAPDVSCWLTPPPAAAGASNRHDPRRRQHYQQQLVVSVMRVPYSIRYGSQSDDDNCEDEDGENDIVDTSIPNPYDSSVVHDKYWVQRRRLFSRFDDGIQLDSEGWFSVTPEIIANHVGQRVGELSNSHAFRRGLPGSSVSATSGIVVLDAFCGCGGNSIAFGRIPSELISMVVCVDLDRSKLRMAAHNASIYNIPKDKIVFVECNTIFILQHCYKDGEFILDKPTEGTSVPFTMPSPVATETYAGYQIGGVNMLPRRIDAVFMDPPWGGVDYEVLGKSGYDLQKNMKIRVGPGAGYAPTPEPSGVCDGGLSDDFFDSFVSQPFSRQAKKAMFNQDVAADNYVDGSKLLHMAAAATHTRFVIYDLPRNTNKTSLGHSAMEAGYRGNIKLEEHYLNGRLKTVTAYLGADYSALFHS